VNDTISKPVIMWEPVKGNKTWADYECPVCGGIERASSFMDHPLMHRHKYGAGDLQSGLVLLRPIRRTA